MVIVMRIVKDSHKDSKDQEWKLSVHESLLKVKAVLSVVKGVIIIVVSAVIG